MHQNDVLNTVSIHVSKHGLQHDWLRKRLRQSKAKT